MIDGVRKLFGMFAAAALLASPMAAIAQVPADGAVPVSPGYILGNGDTIEVSVADSADFKARVSIEQDGTVVLPLIGRVSAAGQPLMQFRDTVRQRLTSGGYFVKPEVSVTLVTATSRYATVLGEVGSPGIVALDREYHLSEVVARVGGVKGNGVDTITLTTADGKTGTYSMRTAATSGGAADPLINPGDKVYVSPANMFYVTGAVGTPGAYPVEAGMSVRQALARSGGISAIGSARKIKITRGDRDIKVTLDEKIQPNDTIAVGERFF